MKNLLKNPVFGGVLLVAGTTLGVGMLAFPAITVFGGFAPSVLLFLFIWLVMLASSFCFLDANLSVKGNNNMISMAEKTLGSWGKVVAWVIYLLLLYSLTAAYIAGATPLFVEAIKDWTGYALPHWVAPFALPLVFGGFVYAGTQGVDLLNRLLMFGLVIAYILLVAFVPQQMTGSFLAHVDFPASIIAIPIVITSFGYHIIIPSLATYMNRDRDKLVKSIVIGSIIPIFVFLLWQLLVIGAVPFNMLATAYAEGSAATVPLARVLQNPFISLAAKLFSFFAIITSFIGVTLSLSDFLTDGFKIKKNKAGRFLAVLLTFIPPLFFVFTYRRGFFVALQYAGAFVAILLVILPALMVWKHKNYKTPAKRFLLVLLMLVGASIIVLDILDERNVLKPLIEEYTQ